MRALLAAAALAGRERLGGREEPWTALACLAIDVTALAAVTGTDAAVQDGLITGSHRLLGGDLAVATRARPMEALALAGAEVRGRRLLVPAEMCTFLTDSSGAPRLVDLRAIDTAWSLVGETVAEGAPAGGLLGGMVVDRTGVAWLGVGS